MLAGRYQGKAVDLNTVFEGIGAVQAGKMTPLSWRQLEGCVPGLWQLFRDVHCQFHELHGRSFGPCSTGKWYYPCR